MFDKILNLKGKQLGTKKNQASSLAVNEDTFITQMAGKISATDNINNDLYIKYDVKRGLRNSNGTGVVVGLTRIGDVVGYEINEKKEKVPVEGKLFYRGYGIDDIVTSCINENRFGFEETTYLLLFGQLPTQTQLKDFQILLGSRRELPLGFTRDMILTAPSVSIMNKLARSVLALYSYDTSPEDTSVKNVLSQSIALIGYFPSLIAYGYQAKRAYFDNQSLHIHYPIPELSTAENILRLIRANGEYTDLEAKLLDICLTLHAEHGGGNNSTFTTHLISSSGTDTYSAISAAVGSLKGPKHGGANIAVIEMLADLKRNVKDITDYKEVRKYLIRVLKGEANDGTGLIYGLGHAIYTLSDPRAVVLKDMAKKLAADKNLVDEFMLCDFIERNGSELYEEVTGVKKPMPANVDLYSGFVYNALNIPTDIATPIFATARLSGWCAHRLEEIVSGKKLMRPAYNCVQPHLEYVPMDVRK
ncbi:MAG: citrate/2-methylcitrate synthase [Peptostreptococcaceae bacterium]|nr:citrate/2-methylcitrate synthase [Peptostreptococcaceae bacterium]